MVGGETYECVKSFCYLSYTLDGARGVDLSATTEIRNGCIKFQELFQFLTSRDEGRVHVSIMYGSETRPLLAGVGEDMQMI